MKSKDFKHVGLCGWHGYIGTEFVAELERRGIVCSGLGRDLYTDFQRLVEWIKKMKPSLIVNCAAYVPAKGVDYCEDDKATTLDVNYRLACMIADACSLTNTLLIHVSTGCLYNGDNGGEGWRETDEPHLSFKTKCGVYVGAKELAERYIEKLGMAYICRVRLPFDEFDHPRNLLTKLMTYPTIVDETQSLAHRGDFVKACLDLWGTGAARGIYNCTNPGSMDYRSIVNTIIVADSGLRQTPFEFLTQEEFDATLARTPKSRCVLNTDKLAAAGVKMRHCHEAIMDSLKNWTPNEK